MKLEVWNRAGLPKCGEGLPQVTRRNLKRMENFRLLNEIKANHGNLFLISITNFEKSLAHEDYIFCWILWISFVVLIYPLYNHFIQDLT